MLKRQCPLTPPPALAAIPSPSDFAHEDQYTLNRGAKRRRIMAPVLNGRERGLQPDDEDWLDEDEEEDFDVSNGAADVALQWEEQAGQYKHANALLHQLHLEHRRRSQSFPPQSVDHGPRSSAITCPCPGQLEEPAHLGTPGQFPLESCPSAPSSSKGMNVMEELNQVRARYEEHNRLLGSLVRQRKQEQGINPK